MRADAKVSRDKVFNKLTVARRHIKAGEKRELELKQEKQSAIGKATDLRRAMDLQSERSRPGRGGSI